MIFTIFFTILILNSPLVINAIIGGQTVHEPHKFPWIVQILLPAFLMSKYQKSLFKNFLIFIQGLQY